MSACWSSAASASSSLARTAAAGSPCAISSAWFGPERTATGAFAITWERRLPLLGSSPFVRMSRGASPGSASTTSLNARLGTAIQTRSASATGASAIGTAGARRPASTTSWPSSSSSPANVVPHDPAPTTTALTFPAVLCFHRAEPGSAEDLRRWRQDAALAVPVYLNARSARMSRRHSLASLASGPPGT